MAEQNIPPVQEIASETQDGNPYLNDPNSAVLELVKAAFALGQANRRGSLSLPSLLTEDDDAKRAIIARADQVIDEMNFSVATLSRALAIACCDENVRAGLAEQYSRAMTVIDSLTSIQSDCSFLKSELQFAMEVQGKTAHEPSLLAFSRSSQSAEAANG